MSNAKRDQNHVPTLIGVSSVDGTTPTLAYVDPSTHRLLVDTGGGGTGTVTTVSVATGNGFAGSVANPTTTPAITISTTVTGLLKGDGTAISAATAGTDYVTPTGTTTLTNKRITKRVVTTTQSATPTINTDNTDVAYITGLAQAVTSFTTNLSGTPVNGDVLIMDITDNGTGRALTFGSSFEASTVALPTTTVSSTKLTIAFRWNVVTSKWTCVAAV